jgi:hypothetical protein
MQTPSYFNTDEFAAALGTKPQTVRARVCKTGSYYGARPLKLPNRMLRWPADALESLLRGETPRVAEQSAA